MRLRPVPSHSVAPSLNSAAKPRRGSYARVPVVPGTFIGRAKEIDEVGRLLRSTRLLTLIGMGGVGKSRLAAESVLKVARDFPAGAFHLDLASTEHRNFGAVIESLLKPHRPVADQAAKFHREARSLLLLDNCDRVSGEFAAALGDIRDAYPCVTILATSREPISARGEIVRLVRPLEVTNELGQFGPAVQLFSDRALAAADHHADDDLATVSEICRNLDGLPAAIELAASHAGGLRPAEMLELTRSSGFLDLQLPSGCTRFATLRDSMRFTYETLSSREQVALRMLSVYPDSFDVAAVASATVGVANGSAAEVTASLLRRSALLSYRSSSGPTTRLRLTNLMKKFVAGMLCSDERERAQGQHAMHFLELAEHAGSCLGGEQESVWAAKLQDDEHNLFAAIEWLQSQEPGSALRLVIAVAPYLASRAKYTVGRTLLASALDAAASDRRQQAIARYWLGYMAMFQRDYSQAADQFHGALEMANRAGDEGLESQAHFGFATLHQFTGNLEAAQTAASRAEACARRSGNDHRRAAALNRPGYVTYLRRDYVRAEKLLVESLSWARRAASPRRTAIVLTNLGELAVSRGHHRSGRKLLDDAAAIWRDLGDDWAHASLLEARAALDLKMQKFEACAIGLREAATILLRLGSTTPTDAFEIAAMLAAAEQRHERSVTLATAAGIHRGSGGLRAFGEDPVLYQRSIAASRAGLGEISTIEAEELGRAMTLSEALCLVCDHLRPAPTTRASLLSRREHQVAQALVEGSTNRQIAAQLGIAPSTVEVHLENIRRKLKVTTRTQIAVWLVTTASSEGSVDAGIAG